MLQQRKLAVKTETPVTEEDGVQSFKSMLNDLTDLISAVGPYCQNFDELLEIAELGKTNEAQARILIDLVTRPKEGQS